MKTWNEYLEEDTYGTYGERYEPVEVECPNCKNRLYKRTDIVLTSYPPQYQYQCLACGWTGFARK